MPTTSPFPRLIRATFFLFCLCPIALPHATAQDRLPSMPGYDRYSHARERIQAVQQGIFAGYFFATWTQDGKALEYAKDGKFYRYDAATGATSEIPQLTAATAPTGRRMGRPARGRQFTTSDSPDGMHRALYRDNNIWLGDADGQNAVALTTDGNAAKRVKYGTASWVYGEELEQITAMWWSPDSKKLAYYRFDESQVQDYYLALDQLKIQSSIDREPYPKAGTPNPVVDIFVYDLETKKTTRLDIRDGNPFADNGVGYYVYHVRWSPDGKELLFNRANRRQNIIAFSAGDPATGHCRTIVQEQNPNGWVNGWPDGLPGLIFLPDGKRFLLISERNGFRNLYLYDLTGKLLNPVTQHGFEVQDVVHIDDKNGILFYTARSGDNPHKLQLHRVGLDGKNDVRLTDPSLNHQVNMAPDGKHFLDIVETHDIPPSTRLLDQDGKLLATLAQADKAKIDAAGFPPTEVFTFKAADGKTDLYGTLQKPSNFDPKRKYPLIVSVYAGPETSGAEERYWFPSTITELGFLVARFDSRGGSNRGRAFKDMMYGKCGVVEIDDQAEGVKFLRQRPYVDGARVGIEGVSYGGYASVMALLRYPDVFQAASASSSVTDWRNYDTIYTERYMGLPQENKAAYDAGCAMTYAGNLKGRLLLYYGTADNNVHPANTLQLVQALQKARKSFELQVGPDLEHTGVNYERMLEFFVENLVLRPVSTP